MLLGQGHALACGEPNASAKPAGRSSGLTVGFFEINILLTKLFEGPRGIVVFSSKMESRDPTRRVVF